MAGLKRIAKEGATVGVLVYALIATAIIGVIALLLMLAFM